MDHDRKKQALIKAQLYPLTNAEGNSWAALFLLVLRFRLIHPFQKA